MPGVADARMTRRLIVLGPSLLFPAAFGFLLWEGTQAQGWSGLAYGAVLALIATISGVAGATVVAIALVLRRRGHALWRWWLASACVILSPAVVFCGLQSIR